MTESSIQVAVRIRPLNAKEVSLLAPVDTSQPFQGDGGLAGSPSKAPNAITAMRTNYIRNILSPVDDKVLVFDPADPSANMRGARPAMHMQFHGNGFGSPGPGGGPPATCATLSTVSFPLRRRSRRCIAARSSACCLES